MFERAILRGLEGGVVATAVMTLYRLPVFRALPPTAEFWAKYVGSADADQYTLQGIVLHFLYGALAGAVFGPLFSTLDSQTSVPRDQVGLVSGLVYGGVLSLFGTKVVFPVLLDQELDPDEELVFHVSHLVYGVTLGTWSSKREALGEAYETPPRRVSRRGDGSPSGDGPKRSH